MKTKQVPYKDKSTTKRTIVKIPRVDSLPAKIGTVVLSFLLIFIWRTDMMQVSLLSTFFDKQTTKDNRPFYAMEEKDFFLLPLYPSSNGGLHETGLPLTKEMNSERLSFRPGTCDKWKNPYEACFSGLEYWKWYDVIWCCQPSNYRRNSPRAVAVTHRSSCIQPFLHSQILRIKLTRKKIIFFKFVVPLACIF